MGNFENEDHDHDHDDLDDHDDSNDDASDIGDFEDASSNKIMIDTDDDHNDVHNNDHHDDSTAATDDDATPEDVRMMGMMEVDTADVAVPCGPCLLQRVVAPLSSVGPHLRWQPP